jgi:hypothetical protein
MPRILDFLHTHDPPFIAKVYRPSPMEAVREGKPGRVEMWLDRKVWEDTLRYGR